MASKKNEPKEYEVSDLEIDTRTRLLVSYSEYMRWIISFPGRRDYTFTGAVILPSEAMKSIGIAFAANDKTGVKSVGVTFNSFEYGFITEIGIFAAYWEESGLTLMLKSNIINLTAVPFIRLHLPISNPVLLAKARRHSRLFLLEVTPNGTINGLTAYKPSRIYPELINIASDYFKITQPTKKVIDRVFRS